MKKNIMIKIFAVSCIAVFVFFNLTVGLIDEKIRLAVDCTENKVFSLSDMSKEYLKTVNEDITFYYITSNGEEYPYVVQTMDRYLKECDRIKLVKLDAVKKPAAVERFRKNGEQIAKGTIVVESSKRFRIVNPGAALKVINTDSVTYSLGFSLEEQLTNAIDFVLRDRNITVTYLDGHGSKPFALPAQKLSDENIDVRGTDNIENGTEGTDMFILFGLSQDLTDSEYAALKKYTEDGGRLFIAVNPGSSCPNIERLLEGYGLIVGKDILTEEDNGRIIRDNKTYLSAEPTGDALSNLRGKGALLFPGASSISITEKSNIEAQSIAVTSDTVKRREIIDGDVGGVLDEGMYSVAATARNTNNGSQLFAASTVQFISPDEDLSGILNSISYINREFFVQTVKTMIGGDAITISIAPKSIMSRSLDLSRTSKIILSIIFIAIPAAVLAIGGIVCFRRRHL